MRTALIVFLALAVSGCGPSRDQVIAQSQNLCASYGFAPGSEAYSNCLMKMDLQRQDDLNARRRDILNSIPDTPMRAAR
jgi:hypothetical protein